MMFLLYLLRLKTVSNFLLYFTDVLTVFVKNL